MHRPRSGDEQPPPRKSKHVTAARHGVILPGHPLPPPAGAEPEPAREGWRRFLVEPRRPEAIRNRPNAHWFAVGTVCIGAFMGQLDASIVTIAFPSLRSAFHAGLGSVTWVGLAYLLVLIALVTAVGRFADMVGHKLLYTYGFMVFIAGSALCGLAPDLGALDGFRVLQAVGAAMLQANSVAIIALAMPPDKLGRGIGIQGTFQALGLALGPSVGGALIALGNGLLTPADGWRLIFFVNVPVGVVATALAWFLIPRSHELQGRVRFDWGGLALFVPAVGTFLYGITAIADGKGQVPPFAIGLLVGSVLLAVVFVMRERATSLPMLDLSLFRRVTFSAGVSSGLLSYLVMFGTLFAVPFYLQDGPDHLSAGAAGLQLTLMPLAFGVVAPFAGRAADRLGARPLTVAGMLLSAASLVALGLARPPGGAGLLVPLAVLGIGLGLFTPPNNAAIMGAAPRAQAGVASGVLNMTRGMGTSMGQAFIALILAVVAANLVDPGQVVNGFAVSSLFLAAVALVAAGLAALRGSVRIASGAPATLE